MKEFKIMRDKMRKNTYIILLIELVLVVVTLTMLTGVYRQLVVLQQKSTLTAYVEMVTPYFSVRIEDGEGLSKGAKATVTKAKGASWTLENISPGDTVTINYTGLVNETDPLQISARHIEVTE